MVLTGKKKLTNGLTPSMSLRATTSITIGNSFIDPELVTIRSPSLDDVGAAAPSSTLSAIDGGSPAVLEGRRLMDEAATRNATALHRAPMRLSSERTPDSFV